MLKDTQNIGNKKVSEEKHWYALTHLNPEVIDIMLQKENESPSLDKNGLPFPPVRYFIPYQFMQHVPSSHRPVVYNERGARREVHGQKGEGQVESNALRDDLHDFVFVYTTEARVESLVRADWNKDVRLYLHYYRDTTGRRVIISDEEMKRLKTILQTMQLQFTIGQPIDEHLIGCKALVTNGVMKGTTGTVTQIRFGKEGIHMRIAFNMFNNTRSITIAGFSEDDVLFEDQDDKSILNNHLVECFQEEVIELLSHRYSHHKPTELETRKDQKALNRLLQYSDIIFEQSDDAQRFLALMLICAYLLRDEEQTSAFSLELTKLLQDVAEPRTATEAYLMTALFVATHNPKLRDAAKAYRQSHSDCPDIIRRFQSITKRIRCR